MSTPPFFYALVDSTETSFLAEHQRVDLDVLSHDISHTEGNFPTLTIEVRNPYAPLLAGKVWIWVARNDNGTPVVEFFGRLVVIPNNIFDEVVTLQFIARSARWLMVKQSVAETLKIRPYYDPIFIDPARRDDPDAVLEAYSAQWHYDRIPSGSPPDLGISISDLLNAEDGVEVFLENEVPYDSVDFVIGQQPLATVKMKAEVHWTQQSAGTLDFGSHTVDSWTGGSLVSEWPKSGTELAGGWIVAGATAYGAAPDNGQPFQHHFNWENREKDHNEGDVMSIQSAWTTYPTGGELHTYNVVKQPGFIDPYGSATLGGEEGVNIPLHVSWSETLVCRWSSVSVSLVLDYEAVRPRKEKIEFKLSADLQPVFSDTNEPASLDTEVVKLPGGDVGNPIINVLSWYTLFLRGGTVPIGTVVESTPEFIDGPIFAVCVGAGSVGSSEPAWSDVLGDTQVDGTVTWAILGPSLPSEDIPTWRDVAGSQVTVGAMCRAQFYLQAPVTMQGVPMAAPPAGTLSFQIAIQGGTTQQYRNSLNTGLADTNPGWPEPHFGVVPGTQTTDGSVIWISLGDGTEADPIIDIPLGLNTAARSFLPTDRGLRALEYLIGYTRAKLLMRSRVIEVTFDCKYERAEELTCRKGVLIYDHRFPGGYVLGKVIAYSLLAHGDQTKLIGKVTIKASAGYGVESGLGSAINTSSGTPTYGDTYDDGSYQYYIDTVLAISSNDQDVGYSAPIDAPNDDGIIFPITDKSLVVVKEAWIVGRPPGAPEYLPNAITTLTNTYTNPFTGSQTTITETIRVPNGFAPVQIPVDDGNKYTGPHTSNVLFFYPITQYYLELKPLQGRSFTTQYNIKTTNLIVPQMINLGGPAHP